MSDKANYKALRQRVRELEAIVIEHKRAKERIKHINAVLSSIRNVSQLVIQEKDPERLIRKSCENLIRHRGYHNAWIALTDESHKILSIAEAGMGENLLPLIKKIEKGELTYCCNWVLQRPDLLAIENPVSLCVDCPMSHKYKGRGAMAIRLEYDGKIYGMLTVSIPSVYSTDQEEHLLFKEVAEDISFALHNIEAEEKRKRAEETLRKARDELERRVKERTRELELLSVKLLNAQEEERKRIAGDLHDGIGQSLSAIKFVVETALEQINGENTTADIHSSLENLVPMLQKASEEVRTIVMNLRPSILDDLGILATIRWFCRQFRSVYSRIRVEEQINIQESEVPDTLKTIIFRVLQEAMNNVAKHSNANILCLWLEKSNNNIIELVIEDNGQGFDVGYLLSMRSLEKGFGITSMKERTELSGGFFEIESAPGAGTVVRASWAFPSAIS